MPCVSFSDSIRGLAPKVGGKRNKILHQGGENRNVTIGHSGSGADPLEERASESCLNNFGSKILTYYFHSFTSHLGEVLKTVRINYNRPHSERIGFMIPQESESAHH